jgi:hypothetical protein
LKIQVGFIAHAIHRIAASSVKIRMLVKYEEQNSFLLTIRQRVKNYTLLAVFQMSLGISNLYRDQNFSTHQLQSARLFKNLLYIGINFKICIQILKR